MHKVVIKRYVVF